MGRIWLETGPVGQLLAADAPAVGMSDRGFAYGDGIFETIRVSGGALLFFGRHMARLQAGAAQLGFPKLPWGLAELTQRCYHLLHENALAEGVLRLVVTRGVGARGFEPPAQGEAHPTLLIQVWPPPHDELTPHSRTTRSSNALGFPAARAIIAPWKVDPASPLCGVKHLSALDKVVARRRARQAGADEALFQNIHGHLVEGAASNLFLVVGDKIVTPALRCGVLAGITRGLLLETASGLPCPVVEAEAPTAILAEAREAFLTNVVMGIRPLVSVENHMVGDGEPGPLTTLVAGHFRQLCAREASSISHREA